MKIQRGYIVVSKQLYETENYFKTIADIFQVARPLKIECEVWKHCDWVIHLESELFDKLEQGEKIPQYIVEITDNKLTFKRC